MRRSASSSLSRSGSSSLSPTAALRDQHASSTTASSRGSTNRSLLTRPRATSGASQDSSASNASNASTTTNINSASISSRPRRAHSDTVSASTTAALSSRQKSYQDYRNQYVKETRNVTVAGGNTTTTRTARTKTNALPRHKTTSIQRSKSIDMGRAALRLNINTSTSTSTNSTAAATSAVPRLSVPFVGIAIEAYTAQRSSEISVNTGDEVRVTDISSSEHWWYGEVISKQIQGWLPRSILMCDGVPTPRDYSTASSSSATTTTATSLLAFKKNSAPLPRRHRTNPTYSELSRPMQALVSPANALLAQRHGGGGRGGSFFNQDNSQGERKTMDAINSFDDIEPDQASKPLRRFLSGKGSQWTEYADKEGNIYFHNRKEDQVDWNRPVSAQPVRRLRGLDGQAWSEFKAKNGSTTYWFNEATGQISHTPPQEERELRTVNSMGGSAWKEHVDDAGSTYWYNKNKQSITYEEPDQYSGDKSSNGGSNTAAPECIICMDRLCCVMLLPCCHANYCQECAERFTECPQCKCVVTHRQRFFM